MRTVRGKFFGIIICWISAITLFFVVRHQVLDSLPASVAMSLGQTAVLALLLFAVRRLSLGGQRIPRPVLWLTVAAVLLAAASEYGYFGVPGKSLVVARLENDPYEKKGTIFRERIFELQKTTFQPPTVSLWTRHFAEIDSPAAAWSYLRSNRSARGVVWGSERWLTVSFARSEPRELRDFNAEMPPGLLAEFRLILNVPAIGLSGRPENETALFLANINNGMTPLPGSKARPDDKDFLRQEAVLRETGRTRALWTSQAHIAYPWFLLGNLYLVDALANGYQAARLECALRAYNGALALLGKGDNPELQAALLNNAAAALVVQAVFEGEFENIQRAYRNLRTAVATQRQPNHFGTAYDTWLVARLNSELLRRRPEKKREDD